MMGGSNSTVHDYSYQFSDDEDSYIFSEHSLIEDSLCNYYVDDVHVMSQIESSVATSPAESSRDHLFCEDVSDTISYSSDYSGDDDMIYLEGSDSDSESNTLVHSELGSEGKYIEPIIKV